MTDMTEKWVTLKESIQSLSLSEATIRRRIKAGKLKSKIENGRRLILIESSNQVTGAVTESVTEELEQRNQGLTEEVTELKAELTELKEEMKKKDAALEEARRTADEASKRHDTVVMQLTKIVEYQQQPFWRKLFQRKQLPPPVDGTIVNMEPGGNKTEE